MNLYIKEAEKRLVATIKQLNKPGAAQAIVFFFSKLISKRQNDNFNIAINVIKDMLKQHIGDIFVMNNSDVVIIHYGRDINVIEGLIKQVLYMLSGEEDLSLDDLMHGQFYQTYFKDENWDDFIMLCKNRTESITNKACLGESYTNILEQHLQKVDWGDVIHIANICRFQIGSKNKVVMQELMYNPQALEVLADFGSFDSRAITLFIRERVDIQLLIFAMQILDNESAEPLILNLRLSTLKTQEFDAFINFATHKNKRKLVIAVDIADIVQDFPTWLSIRERLARLNVATVIDSVDLLLFLQIDPASLGFDYVRIHETEKLKVKDCVDFENEISAKVQSMAENTVIIKLMEDRSQIYLEELGIQVFC